MTKSEYQLLFNQYEKELLKEQTLANEEKIDFPRYYRAHNYYLMHKAIALSADYAPSTGLHHFRMAKDYIREMIDVCKKSKEN